MLSIITTFRNEKEVLPSFLARLRKVLDGLSMSWEVVLINDASTDQTAKMLEDYASIANEIKMIHMSRRFGVQACILAGIEHASGNAVITMDADLQDPPELIPKMIQKWREGHEIVHMVRSSREGESALKMALTKLAYQCLALMSEVPFQVEAGDFKLLSRRAVTELLKHKEKMPYLRGLIASLGLSQASLFYKREKRFAGTSHFALLGRGPVETFISGLTSFSPFPLYLFLIAGVFFSSLSCVIFLILLLLGLYGNWHAQVWLINFFFLLLSLNLFGMGLLGIYVWNILKQTLQRPLYLIERKINF